MFSQAAMDRLGLANARMLGDRVETITYYSKSGPSASPVTHSSLEAYLDSYQLHELGAVVGQNEIIQTDRKCRIRSTLVNWIPTQYDELVRADGSRWRVLSESEGTGKPWAILPVRRIG